MADPPGWLARRPLVAVAVALIAGITAADRLPHAATAYLVVAGLSVAAAAFVRHALFATAALLIATTAAGVALCQLDRYHYPADHLGRYGGDDRRLAEVELKLNEAPRVVQTDFGQRRALPPKQAFVGDAVRVRTWAGWRPAAGRVLVQSSEIHPTLAAGQTVRVLATLDRPAAAMNPGQFDWAEYYRRQRVLVSLHVPHAKNVTVVDDAPAGRHAAWLAWTRENLARGFTAADALDHALLRALVLGDPDPELRDVQEQFRATGTSHHLAISGMHIAVMGGCVFLVMRLLRTSPRTAWLTAMAFVVAYGAAALPSPPVVRAVLTWLAVGVAVVGRRPVDFLHLLAGVVVAMLVYQPADLFNAGFQLSFGTVLGLILFAGPTAEWIGGRTLPDPHDPPPRQWALRLARRIDSQIVLVLAAGVTAWLVSMPLIATHFTQLNPWAVLAGIVLAPVVFAALIGGLLKIALTAAWPGMAGVWAAAADGPVALMRRGVAWMATWPMGDVPLPAPPLWLVAIFYGSMATAAYATKSAGVRLVSRLAFLLALAGLLALPYRAASADRRASGGGLRLTLLAVGAGQCAVIESPGRVTLVDAGSLTLADPVRRCVGPFLRDRGVTSLDKVFVTHADADHYGAVGEIAEAYAVDEVLTANGFEAGVGRNAVGQSLLAKLAALNRPPRHVAPGQRIPLGAATDVDVLWPPDATPAGSNTNDRSLVLRLTHGRCRVLFTGDIQDDAMRELLRTPDALKADVLIAPHHGSREAMTSAFLKAVDAKVILSSDDRTPTRKQTAFDAAAGTTPLYRTGVCGAVTVRVGGDGAIAVTPQVGGKTAVFR